LEVSLWEVYFRLILHRAAKGSVKAEGDKSHAGKYYGLSHELFPIPFTPMSKDHTCQRLRLARDDEIGRDFAAKWTLERYVLNTRSILYPLGKNG
jgi:hypothetical protein